MDSIGCELSGSDTSPSKTKGQGAKRTRYYKNLAIGKVVHVNMLASEHAPGQISPEVHQIRVYIADRKTIWLHNADVERVVRMLASSQLSGAASVVSA